MPEAWRTVRVFISSTFRDMQAERDHLVRFVFPRLREELLKRRIHLVDVDLRWGVTSEQDALEVCREIIDECRPRFTCILGGRYGWVPPGKEHSITADEVRYGVLDRLEAREYRYFYFRYSGATDSIAEEVARGAGYIETDPASAQKLADLKQAVRDAGFEPFVYPAQWDDTSRRLAGLEEFGNRVYSDLLASVDDEYGVEPPEALDEFAEEDAATEAFIEERVQRYVLGSRQSVFDELARFARADGEPSITALTGPSGCGKSALLGRFSQDYARDHPDALVITHFVGASAGSTDLRRTLRRLCHALAQAAEDEREIPQEVKELTPRFEELLASASQHQRIVLILDALNQLDATDNAHSIYWLPRSLPSNARVIVSSLEHPALDALLRRGAAAHTVTLKPLDETDSRLIIQGFTDRYHKHMTQGQIEAILAKPDSGNPLYLLVALEELRTLDVSDKVSRGLSQDDAVEDAIRQLPDGVQPLFLWVLKRLEQDDGFRDADRRLIGKDLVRQFVSCLGVSRHGLSQAELAELLAPGEQPDAQGNVAALARLLRPYLMHRGELLDFYHNQLREAVQAEYLDEEAERLTAHRQVADYFHRRADPVGDSTWATSSPRALSELPYHQTQAGHLCDAYKTLADFRFVEAKCGTDVTSERDEVRERNVYRGVYHVLDDYAAWLKAYGEGPESTDADAARAQGLPEVLRLLQSAIRSEARHCAHSPSITAQQTRNALTRLRASPSVRAAAIAEVERSLVDRIWLRERCSVGGEGSRMSVTLPRTRKFIAAFYVPDGSALIAVEDDAWHVWCRETGEPRLTRQLEPAAGHVVAAAVSPDSGTLALLNADGDCSLWELATGDCKAMWQAYARDRYKRNGRIAFSPDSSYVATLGTEGLDVWARVWSVPAGRKVGEADLDALRQFIGRAASAPARTWSGLYLEALTTPVAVGFCGDSETVMAASRGIVQVWNWRAGTVLWRDERRVISLARLEIDGAITCLAPLAQEKAFILGDDNGNLALYNLHSPPEKRTDLEDRCVAIDACVSPERALVATLDTHGACRLWRCGDGEEVAQIQDSALEPRTVGFSPGGTSVLITSSGMCSEYELPRIAGRSRPRSRQGQISAADIAADGSRAICSFYGTLVGIDLTSGDEVWRTRVADCCLSAVKCLPDGQLVACGGDDGAVRIHRPGHEDPVAFRSLNHGGVRALAVSRAGEMIAAGTNEGRWAVWEWRRGRATIDRRALPGGITAIELSPTGDSLIVAAEDEVCRIYDIRRRRVLASLQGHTAWLTCLGISADGCLLATGSVDHTVRIWDLRRSGAAISVLEHRAEPVSVTFHRNGRVILSIDWNGDCNVWDVHAARLLCLYPAGTAVMGAKLSGNVLGVIGAYGALRVASVEGLERYAG
jgi:WD40 repeat protein